MGVFLKIKVWHMLCDPLNPPVENHWSIVPGLLYTHCLCGRDGSPACLVDGEGENVHSTAV